MNKVNVIGLDLAKNVFQVHGVDAKGHVVIRRQLKRAQVLAFFANLEPCLVGMEACGGFHYWARAIGKLGHTVRAMAPAFVKPYVRSNKNDRNDAEAICEAVQRPSMRFVPVKTVESQSVLQLHRARQLLVGMRVALTNQMRAMLSEFGITIPKGAKELPAQLPAILENADNGLLPVTRALLATLGEHYREASGRIERIEASLRAWHRASEASLRLAAIPGIGVLTATALVGTVGDAKAFPNGRALSAYLGLVPRQHATGGKAKLLGISKRGDHYLRTLLIHGARAVVRSAKRRMQAGTLDANQWLPRLLKRSHPNNAAVAQANKTARIAWALLACNRVYRPAAAEAAGSGCEGRGLIRGRVEQLTY